ncbi:MAG: PLDc N-terminal domain-containing protein, partial [Mycobacteriales bacterium]
MLFLGGFGVVLELLLLFYCVLNIVTTPEDEIRNLPKLVWLVLVVILPLVGGIAWLVGGRPQRPAGGRPVRAPRRPPAAPHAGQGSDWPTRSASPNPDDDEAFLRS